MPLPVLSLSLAGSDPKTASVTDLEAQVNAGFAALWGQTYVGGEEFAIRAETAADRVDLGALDLAVSQSTAAAADAVAAATTALAASRVRAMMFEELRLMPRPNKMPKAQPAAAGAITLA